MAPHWRNWCPFQGDHSLRIRQSKKTYCRWQWSFEAQKYSSLFFSLLKVTFDSTCCSTQKQSWVNNKVLQAFFSFLKRHNVTVTFCILSVLCPIEYLSVILSVIRWKTSAHFFALKLFRFIPLVCMWLISADVAMTTDESILFILQECIPWVLLQAMHGH